MTKRTEMALATKLAPPFFAGYVLRLSIHITWTFYLSTLLKSNGLLKSEANCLRLTAQAKQLASNFSDSDVKKHIEKNGGAEEDRTPDLLRARQALSQLSYGPFFRTRSSSST